MTGPNPQDLADAQGKFAAFIAIMLQRAGVAEVSQFAALLAAFAETVTETDPEQGRLLADWAAVVRATQLH